MLQETSRWNNVIAEGAKRLELSGISDAQANAEYLAMHVLGLWKRGELHNFLPKILTKEQSVLFGELIARRLRNEPLQHIIGETEFFGLRLLASEAALIPRPDTEILVEEAINEVTLLSGKQIKILDIGTGSGAIALAIASKLPPANILGIDISPEAIDLANENKKRLRAENVSFDIRNIFHGDLSEFFASFDLIVSNPPYISLQEFELLESEVRDFDPRIALTDEGDGLSFYRRIAEIAPKLLKNQGKVLVEVGYNSMTQVENIFTNAGLEILRKVKDLQGIERVIVAKLCVF